MNMQEVDFFRTAELFSVAEVFVWLKSGMPKEAFTVSPALKVLRGSGCYAWFFDAVAISELNGLNRFEANACVWRQDFCLLYLGTSSAKDSTEKTKARPLHTRLKNHLCGTAASSTLRRSLGALLNIPLVTHKTKYRLEDEGRLTNWLSAHARLCWQGTATPRTLEERILTQSAPWLPLNLSENHPTEASRCTWLKMLAELRGKARREKTDAQ